MRQLAKFGLILAAICFAAALVLALTYRVTKPAIAARAEEEEREALRLVLPDADDFVRKGRDGAEYYEGYRDKRAVGYCIRAFGNGYGGYFRGMVGIDRSGVIQGLLVLEHQETPGLGAKIGEVRPGEKDAWFLRQFKGKDGATVSMGDIDAVTGATISSRAVVDAVREAVGEFMKRVRSWELGVGSKELGGGS